MEAGLMKIILLSGSRIFYKIYNKQIYFAPNCPGRIVREPEAVQFKWPDLIKP